MKETKYDNLIQSAKLSGRIDLLMELRDWVSNKIVEAEQANEDLRVKLNDSEKEEL